jgi:hypothetical protein
LDAALRPMPLGFYATLILEAAQRSLGCGQKMGSGSTYGSSIDLRALLHEELGPAAGQYLSF